MRPATLFRSLPALWAAIAGDALRPAAKIPAHAADDWRVEDADADLGSLPPSHQAVVLALAPWRTEDAAPAPVRMQRLLDAWDALSDDERAALVLAHPSVLATVAAAARRCGGASAAVAAVGATVGRFAAATGGADAKGIVGAMLRTPDDQRDRMASFAPTAADPPEAWSAWRRAVRRGIIADLAPCARLADYAPRRARRRAGR